MQKKFQPYYDELIKQGYLIDKLYEDIENIWQNDNLPGYDPCANNFDDLQELSLYLFLLNNNQEATVTEINNRLGRIARVTSYRSYWSTGICRAISKLYYKKFLKAAGVVPHTIIHTCNKMGYLGIPEAEQFLELLNNFNVKIDVRKNSLSGLDLILVGKIESRYQNINFIP